MSLAVDSRAQKLTPPAATMWLMLVAIVIADAIDMVDSTLTNIAAPTIAAELGGGGSLITWLGSAYAMAMGALLVLGGRLGDRYGQRRTFLIAIAGFSAASMIAGLAISPAMIIVGRLLQGSFGAMLIPQGMAIMAATFPKETLAKAFGVFGPMLGVAMVGGPLLGAFIIDADLFGLSWRPMFLVNLVLGAVAFVIAWRVFPRTNGDKAVRIDGVGAGLLSGAMFLAIYGLVTGSEHDWNGPAIAMLAGAVALFAGFAARQRTSPDPLLKASLLRNRGFKAGLAMGFGYFGVVGGLAYVVSLFLQTEVGLSPVRTALQGILPLTVGIIVASAATAPLILAWGRGLVLAGLGLTLVSIGWLWVMIHQHGTDIGTWTLAPVLVTLGVAFGACFGTIFNFAIGDVDADEAGSASGSLSAIQMLATAGGAAAFTTIWFSSATHGPTVGFTTSLVVVAAITVACLGLVPLLPRRAAEDMHGL
jgi:EmrB/QacA subfamily drug resistance transporter